MTEPEDWRSLDWLDAELAALDQAQLRRSLRTRQGQQKARIELDGRSLLNFGSNDYLGLAADPRLSQAAAAAAEEEGWGSGASPLVTGHSSWHERLERRLAEFEGTEAALVFPSGFATNTSTIPALVGSEDAVFSDEYNHASIIDGCRLSRAKVFVYPHLDVVKLQEMLEGSASFRRRLIVTDSIFSMDGDLAPLTSLAGLAQQYDTMLMVDEAHATGVFCERGRGISETLDEEHAAGLIRIGTLSKALGCSGGFVAGSRKLIDWLVSRARGYVFSTASLPANAAAAIEALRIVEDEPERRTRLLACARSVRQSLGELGWNVQRASHIIPVIVGEPQRALQLSADLAERGLFVPAIRPPSVPQGQSRLRISLSFRHTEEMLAELCDALAELR